MKAFAFAAPAFAVTPVNLRSAESYAVLANAVTSNGATAMSEDLGSTMPAGRHSRTDRPRAARIGTAADSAKADADLAYGDAALRGNAGSILADLAGASFTPGVYNATAARGFTAAGVLTLDAGDDAGGAVFIFQIGGALSIGAGAQVNLVHGLNPCNVFGPHRCVPIDGANATFAGTVMATADVSVGAGSRVDGRLLGKGAVTLASNPVRTACAASEVVVGPAGPAGPAGADGAAGTAGAAGQRGPSGADGADGADGVQGATGVTGSNGSDGATGLTGSNGATGATGANGSDGAAGATGLTGSNGAQGATGLMGDNGLMGATGLAGIDGATGPTGLTGSNGATGATGLTGSNGARAPPASPEATARRAPPASPKQRHRQRAGRPGATGAAGLNGTSDQSSTTGSTSHSGAAGTTSCA